MSSQVTFKKNISNLLAFAMTTLATEHFGNMNIIIAKQIVLIPDNMTCSEVVFDS